MELYQGLMYRFELDLIYLLKHAYEAFPFVAQWLLLVSLFFCGCSHSNFSNFNFKVLSKVIHSSVSTGVSNIIIKINFTSIYFTSPFVFYNFFCFCWYFYYITHFCLRPCLLYFLLCCNFFFLFGLFTCFLGLFLGLF